MPIAQKIRMYYDPRGNVIRTVNPDGCEQWVVHGKPDTLSSVRVNNHWSFKNYAPTPWESYTYDANDLATVTHGVASGHDFTPKSALVDALGRTVKTVDRLNQTTADNVLMKYAFDIRGNLLQVTDALGRIAFEYKYDLRPQPKKEGEKLPPIATWHIDSGNKKSLLDATAKAIELTDAKGARIVSSYDTISRPVNVWAKDKQTENFTLRQYQLYGDSAGLANPENKNYKGKLYQQYDEAGMQEIGMYDYKGNATEKIRKVISDAEILSVFGGNPIECYRVDWTGLDTSILDTKIFETSLSFDSLNRITQLQYPIDADNERKVLQPIYNKAGSLESVKFEGTDYVKHIAYNAKGQRLLVAFGNGIMTRQGYDSKTFRLRRMRTESYTQTGFQFTSGGSVKQDTSYQYDLIGNITSTNENVTNCGIGGANQLLREFDYDALNRLLQATGRENAPTIAPYWDDSFRSENDSITTGYTQNYSYDKLGNILQLQHIGSNNFTRNFNYLTVNNKLQSIDVGQDNVAYSYDTNGNQLSETSSRKIEWDAADRMRSFYVEASGSVSQYTHYLYDAGGTRVKKITRKQNGTYTSDTYIDSIYEYKTDGTDEQNTLHVMDDRKRIATIRLGNDFGDNKPAIKYNLEDHLGSSTMQLEANGAWVNKEEYYPFGETSFGSYEKKRYKYCGKERDDESGLYYYGARYYNAWTCRFVSVDPLKDKYTFYTPYQYAGNKPINFIDLDGFEEAKSNATGSNQPHAEANLAEQVDKKTHKITYALTLTGDTTESGKGKVMHNGKIENATGEILEKINNLKTSLAEAKRDQHKGQTTHSIMYRWDRDMKTENKDTVKKTENKIPIKPTSIPRPSSTHTTNTAQTNAPASKPPMVYSFSIDADFKGDRFALTEEGKALLQPLVDKLKANPNYVLDANAFTGALGPNDELSFLAFWRDADTGRELLIGRVNWIKNWMISQGVQNDQLHISFNNKSYGSYPHLEGQITMYNNYMEKAGHKSEKINWLVK